MTWTFRKIALGSSIALFAILTLLTSALVMSKASLHRTAQELVSVSNSLQVTQELESNILVHSRESLLWYMTGNKDHLEHRENVEAVFKNWIAQSEWFDDSAAGLAQLENVKKSADVYFLRRIEYEGKGALTKSITSDVTVYTDDLLANIRKLTKIEVGLAEGAQTAAGETEREIVFVGVFTILTAIIGLAIFNYLMWRHIYIPIHRMADSIVSLAGGGKIVPVQTKVHDLSIIWQALDESARKLQERKSTQLRYLAAVAHDLRNPIGAIAASASFLSDSIEQSVDAAEITKIIDRQVGYLNNMVSDLLDTTRAEDGNLSLKLTTQDLRLAVGEAVGLFRGYSKIHTISYDRPEVPILCKFDTTRISQVLNNLISNAIKYSPLGGKITLTLAREESTASIRISDTGMGISKQDIHSIFEPFRRSTLTQDIIPGVGLGLFTSQKIVGSHGGTIRVESVKGEGSTFIVRIPIL